MTIQDVSVLKALQLNKASVDRQAKQHDIDCFRFVDFKERRGTSFSNERIGFTSIAAEPRSI